MTTRREFLQFFRDADKDGSGYLSADELGNILKAFGYNLTEAQVHVSISLKITVVSITVEINNYIAVRVCHVPSLILWVKLHKDESIRHSSGP